MSAFPTSPTNGQTVIASGSLFQYNSTKTRWEMLSGTSATAIIKNNFVATAGQTVFSASGTISAPAFVDVYLNGIKLVTGTDFTIATNTITLLSPCAASDDVEIVVFQAVTPANVLPTSGGTLTGQLTLPVNSPVSDYNAVHKSYVDATAMIAAIIF